MIYNDIYNVQYTRAQAWVVSGIWAYVFCFGFCNYIKTIAWKEITLQIVSSSCDKIVRIHFMRLNTKFLAFSDFCWSSKAKNDNSHLRILEIRLDSSMPKIVTIASDLSTLKPRVCQRSMGTAHTPARSWVLWFHFCLWRKLIPLPMSENKVSLGTTFRTQVLKDWLSFLSTVSWAPKRHRTQFLKNLSWPLAFGGT